ncbi:MAG: response regulator [Deltaproteobacteria bacterium]|nr:response regulator [Deltaproteobacteria bacterium]
MRYDDPEKTPTETQSARGVILVLQTTQQECQLLKEPLRNAGFAVKTTTDAEEAIEFYENRKPDLIVIPAYLVNGSSYAFCRKIRDEMRDRTTPILLTTALVSGRLMIEARTKWGVNDVVVMPLTVQRLYQAVGQLLGVNLIQEREREAKSPSGTATDFRLLSQSAAKKAINPVGDLLDVRPERVLRLMALNKRTGVVEFTSEQYGIALHFREGLLGHISSGLIPGLTLADHLAATRDLPAGVIKDAQTVAIRTRRLLGEVLLEMGSIHLAELELALRRQMIEKGVSVFGWAGGRYVFNKKAPEIPSDTSIALSVEELIFRGVRRFFRPDDIAILYPRFHSTIFTFVQDKGFRIGDLQLTDEERRAVFAMTGRNRVNDLLDVTGWSLPELTSMIAALTALKMVRAADTVA